MSSIICIDLLGALPPHTNLMESSRSRCCLHERGLFLKSSRVHHKERSAFFLNVSQVLIFPLSSPGEINPTCSHSKHVLMCYSVRGNTQLWGDPHSRGLLCDTAFSAKPPELPRYTWLPSSPPPRCSSLGTPFVWSLMQHCDFFGCLTPWSVGSWQSLANSNQSVKTKQLWKI